MLKIALATLALSGPALADCAGTSGPCEIASGTYNIRLPEGYNTQTPVVIFLHGYGGSGKGTIRSKKIADPILKRGYALIAPNAIKPKGARASSWNFHPSYDRGRNEAAFFKQVFDDAVKRFGLNPKQVLLAGFSIGGSMVSYVACNNPENFTAFAPVSGSFWRPHPTKCTAPVKLFHTHGWSDTVVPLEGRHINERFIQGDVFYALDLWRKTNLCAQPRPDKISRKGSFMRRKWQSCARGSALEFALFPGGHTVPKGWADMVLDWYENLPETVVQK
ncbi:MAG: alpha/beta fold hydrolase [Amylibacter sp.]|nr:alpha/beta fold hydrolase [Amylibacter sp.]